MTILRPHHHRKHGKAASDGALPDGVVALKDETMAEFEVLTDQLIEGALPDASLAMGAHSTCERAEVDPWPARGGARHRGPRHPTGPVPGWAGIAEWRSLTGSAEDIDEAEREEAELDATIEGEFQKLHAIEDQRDKLMHVSPVRRARTSLMAIWQDATGFQVSGTQSREIFIDI
jgi:hypothetical protein